MTTKTRETPKALGYAMPAEWERHEAIWLAWPHDAESFGEGLPKVEDAYALVISEIHKSERVELLVTGESMRARVRTKLERAKIDPARVRFHEFPYADVWIRDYGPTFVTKKGAPLGAVRWVFNAWGGKYKELLGDTKAPSVILKDLGAAVFEPGVILEGGSIEVDGAGTVLATKQCLLNKNRNPTLSRARIEAVLRNHLGVSRVVWLGEGIAGDDTDGHIDDVARFFAKGKVLCAVEDDKSDENYAPLKACAAALAKDFDVLTLPMPDPVAAAGRRLPASYANFYVGNGVVLAPVFGAKQDAAALGVLEKAFPGRRVAAIPCREWVRGLGAVHCGSQQQPAV